jgi:hypothetical protein
MNANACERKEMNRPLIMFHWRGEAVWVRPSHPSPRRIGLQQHVSASNPPATSNPITPAGTVVADAATLACDRLIRTLGSALQLQHADTSARTGTLAAPIIEFSRALLQMKVRPALAPRWRDLDPVHVVMFGGTNSGKSTVMNLLLGRAGAAMNATARFSQHPVAFVRSAGPDLPFLDSFPSRFRDYQRFIDRPPTRQSDVDLRSNGYKPALSVISDGAATEPSIAPPAVGAGVLWDAPDFSTEEARFYLRAVLDAVALADVVVLCVTGESYANDLVARLARMVAGTGVALHVAANKLDAQLEPLGDIVSKLRQGDGTTPLPIDADAVHPLRIVDGTDVADRFRKLIATPEAAKLRSAVAADASHGESLKRETLAGAVRFLAEHFDRAIQPLADEVSIGSLWADLVQSQARTVLSDRYRTDYVNSARYSEFNQTLLRVLEQLDVPYVGQVVRGARAVVRKPMKWALDFVRGKLLQRKPELPPEEDVLGELIKQWFTRLRGEVQRLAAGTRNTVWYELDRKLADADVRSALLDKFADGYLKYRDELDEQEKQRAAEMYDAIDKRPILKNALRTGNLGLDALAVVFTVKSFGLDWSDAVLGPALLMVRQTIVDTLGEQFLAAQRTQLMNWQAAHVDELIQTSLVNPVRELISTRARRDELDQARKDFETVRRAALRIAADD